MATFEVDGRTYELLTLDQIQDLTLGEVEVLQDIAGIKLGDLVGADGVDIDIKFVLGFVTVSMQRTNPAATIEDARKVKMSVLSALGAALANEGDAVPPTPPEPSGRQDSGSASA